MLQLVNILIVPGAYLIGSIPSSIWIGRMFFNTDVREYGSGNAGATNTFRVLGTKPGIIVFILDLMKGFLAVKLANLNPELISNPEYFLTLQLILGVAAILGHVFPLYVGFKGGKGVATLFGVILGISLLPTLIMAGVFFVTLFATRYVSLSSIIAGISFPILTLIIFNSDALPLVIFSIAIPLLIIFTHQKNIERLLHNNESKADLSKFGLKGKK
ncbi:MAG: glycerol-3-phosphate 1-O-acyltransferase PlsY [Bacteroidales bacterium]|nr:glycerol-3-phosphate 1-O-acyltransferase PlsY [Bacteroidales bacterium]MBS3775226.1 glycerol-3-phosphate 1-O-acyltransferase PlsY [Bacteroidales bacterium]